MTLDPVNMTFNYEGSDDHTPEAYETLLLDVMHGDATLFTRADEVEAQWRLITPIEEVWAQQRIPELSEYAAGTDGPEAADRMLARNGHRWRRLNETLGTCD
jgi:glucose-6-phosphate 1-dehydrogenase